MTAEANGRERSDPGSATRWHADDAVTALHAAHYRSLVRLAALLIRDTDAAEDIVQDAFVAMHGRWHRLRDPDKALAYLRRCVANGAHSVLRRRSVAARHRPDPPADEPAADAGVLSRERDDQLVQALAGLPLRQREVLVLRHYLDLSEAEIAATLGISRGAVKSHSSRGLDNLRTTLEPPR